MTLKEAKANLIAVSQGKKPRKKPTLEEARINLLKTDPGIDISAAMGYIQKQEYSKAFFDILLQIITMPEAVEYFAPVLKEIINLNYKRF